MQGKSGRFDYLCYNPVACQSNNSSKSATSRHSPRDFAWPSRKTGPRPRVSWVLRAHRSSMPRISRKKASSNCAAGSSKSTHRIESKGRCICSKESNVQSFYFMCLAMSLCHVSSRSRFSFGGSDGLSTFTVYLPRRRVCWPLTGVARLASSGSRAKNCSGR